MNRGNYHIKRKIGGKGIYVKIALNVSTSIGTGWSIKGEIDEEWKESIKFGIHYFYEHYKLHHSNKINVEFDLLKTAFVDTTPIIVVYGITKALEEALGIKELYSPSIDVNGDFIFHK